MITNYGRYGYLRITAMLRKGYLINHKRVERIWREQSLKGPQKAAKVAQALVIDDSFIKLQLKYRR